MFLPILLLAAHIEPANVSVPYRQPQLAAGHGEVAMVFGGGSSLYFASSSDQGRTFRAPVKVAEVGALALGRHRGPRLVILKDAMVITAIAGAKKAEGPHAHGLPEAGDLLTWRSTDHGKTWQRAGTVNDVPGAAREGLHAMVARRDGSLFATWLDLRSAGTKLYASVSRDGGVSWQKNVQVYESPDGTICQCCHPSLVADGDRVLVMWRNAVGGSRDLYLTVSSDGEHFAVAKKLGQGTWKLNACPMDGGAIAIDHGQTISAWRRDGEIFLTDAAGAEKSVGKGKDVAMVVGRQGPYLAWTQETGLAVLTPKSGTAAALAPVGGFVTLLPLPAGGVLAAWEANGSVETKLLD